MENSYKGRYCGVCEHELPHGYFSLSKRSQSVTGNQPGVVLVSDDALLTDFCGQECADYAEAAISSTLSSPYGRYNLLPRGARSKLARARA